MPRRKRCSPTTAAGSTSSETEDDAMAQDLRSFLDLIKRKKPEDFQIVGKPVDPAYEITALVVKLEREAKQRPVLIFENVRGTKFPVLTNLHASRRRLAAAMGVAPPFRALAFRVT